MDQYKPDTADGNFSVRLVASTTLRSHYEVMFPSPRPTIWKEGAVVYGDYFVPQSTGRVPLLILVHGYGDESVAPCLTLARLLVKQAIATFVLYLPIHSRRLPEAMKGGFSPENPRVWLDTYQSSILEIRRIVDWASNREEIDSNRITLVGFSLGGMISSISMATDKRVSAGIFIVTGGNMEELSWGGLSHTLPIGHTCTREECRIIYNQYPAFLNEVKEKGLGNVIPPKECFLFDPLTYAAQLRGRPVLMINATDDEIVPQHAVLNLWEACGRPRLVWIPGTHAGAYSQTSLISDGITQFVQSI